MRKTEIFYIFYQNEFQINNALNIKIDLNVKLETKRSIIFPSLLQNLEAILKIFSTYQFKIPI